MYSILSTSISKPYISLPQPVGNGNYTRGRMSVVKQTASTESSLDDAKD